MTPYYRWLLLSLAAIIVATTVIVEWQDRKTTPAPTPTLTPSSSTTLSPTPTEPPAATTTPSPTPSSGITTLGDVLRVTSPTKNSLVTSPLKVTGSARGTWYFEASFPVRLLDSTGKEIAVTPAQAKTDWMTTDYVEFEATLHFTAPSTKTGTLILQKDNPSGLPENDQSLEIPVTFR